MNIESLIYNDISNLSKEEQETMKIFNNKLREELISELVLDIQNNLIKTMKKSKDEFNEIINNMIVNGYIGLKDMNTQTLLNLYLEKKNEVDFINLMEKINL